MAIRTPKTIGPFSPRAGLTTVLWAAAAAAAVVGAPLAASAQVTIKFPTVVPAGNTVPDGSAPWLTAVINDIATNVISITLTPDFVPVSPGDLDFQDFISEVAFKLNYAVGANSILPAFSATSPPDSTNPNQFVAGAYPQAGDCIQTGTFFCGFFGSGIPTNSNPQTASGEDATGITGGGNLVGSFDFNLVLPPSPGNPENTLGDGDSATFYVRGAGLSASAFGTERNPEGWTACAKVQGIGTGSGGSSVICDGIHEGEKVPGPLPLLGAAAAFGYSRKIRTRIQGSRQQATIS